MNKNIFFKISLSYLEAKNTIARNPPPFGIDPNLELKSLTDFPARSAGNFLGGMGIMKIGTLNDYRINLSGTRKISEQDFDFFINHSLKIKLKESEFEKLHSTTRYLASYMYSQGKELGNQGFLKKLLERRASNLRSTLAKFVGDNDFYRPKLKRKSGIVNRDAKVLLKSPDKISLLLRREKNKGISGYAYYQFTLVNDRPEFWFQGISFLPVPTEYTYLARVDLKIRKFFKLALAKDDLTQISAYPYQEFPQLTSKKITSNNRSSKNVISENDLEISVNKKGNAKIFHQSQQIRPIYLFNHVKSQHSSKIQNFLRLLADERAPHFMTWRWGSYANEIAKPRLQEGNIIISPNSWRIQKLVFFKKISIASWREKRGIPEKVILCHGNYRFKVDLNDREYLKKIQQRLESPIYKKSADVILEESIPDMPELSGRSIEICLPFET